MEHESCTCQTRCVYVIDRMIKCSECMNSKGRLINQKPGCLCSKFKPFDVEIRDHGAIVCKKCNTTINETYRVGIKHMLGDLVMTEERSEEVVEWGYESPPKKEKFSNLGRQIYKKIDKHYKVIVVMSGIFSILLPIIFFLIGS